MDAHFFKFLGTLLLVALASTLAWGSHNRAGEIRLEQIGPLKLRATIITYTKASSTPADRDTLSLCWGDGVCQQVPRSNGGGNGVNIGNDIKYNEYVSEHTYSGISTYLVSMTDPNRNLGILNVNWPNSDAMMFHLQTSYTFLNPQFQGENSTPQLLQPPIDFACVGQMFLHNPNAYDADGDSLAYQLIVPLQNVYVPVSSYVWPNMVGGGSPTNFVSLNPVTGTFAWETPQIVGEYNIAFIVISYRDGVPIDTTVRDMQIFVQPCDNLPPVVETEDKICVIAGDLVSFDVTASDPDDNQLVRLTALGGPFQVPISPATFDGSPYFLEDPFTRHFEWQTTCEHISDQFYSVVFKATDNTIVAFGNGDTTGLSTLKTVRIKVVGPPPLDVQAAALPGQISVSWQKPYICEGAADDYFYRFSVWRRIGSNPFDIDTCETGLDGKGYERVVWMDDFPIVNGRYQFDDTDVERGRTYCYRILAHFAKLSAAGNPFNFVESLPSDEVCMQLSRDIPIMTNVSITTTEVADGNIEVRWTRPVAEELDTLLNLPPYRYQLLRTEGIGGVNFVAVEGADFSANSFSTANDTFFLDTNQNTRDKAYTYKVAFYVNNEAEPFGTAEAASSVRLNVGSSDEVNTLTWDYSVPWANYSFDIYKRDNASGNFSFVTNTVQSSFTDPNLVNGTEYCYYIQTIGDYGIEGIAAPLLNLSQIACGVPLDTLPPCAPTLSVDNLCTQPEQLDPNNPFLNYLSWSNPEVTCPPTDDVAGYNIYFAAQQGDELILVETISSATDTTYQHQSDLGLAGCYAVTAFDALGNESQISDPICVDNCPIYELPNAFTPNGDNQNDLFRPRKNLFIGHIDLRIFNQWGDLVFRTDNPDINWDGTDSNGKRLAPATYFYRCQVFEQRVNGEQAQPALLSGFIELLRE